MRANLWIKRALLAVVLLSGSFCVAMPPQAEAGHRFVTVNGMLLGPQELAIADRNAGFRVPDGHYWYDLQSGYWGPVGGPAVGRVPPQLREAPAPQQGWSRRNDTTGEGMIYNPEGGSWQDRVWVSPR